ncbi:MAG: hypothetical protein NC906_01460 [Candidatus Omnitrophica bacterium]|nr:hypothetical protein [Candidatus Omnitrophota bacterium]MCM8817685.1 hypothetical protein [Candidatus Omnitrophota bacterium]
MKKFLLTIFCLGVICLQPVCAEKKFPIFFVGDPDSIYWVIIRDNSRKTVKFIPAVEQEKGKYIVVWDGTDYAGKNVVSGKYFVFISKGIEWTLDKSFGMNGRIGIFFKDFYLEAGVDHLGIQGEIISVSVKGVRYENTGDKIQGETGFIISDGKIKISRARISDRDAVRVVYYYPFFLENPWDLAIAPDGDIFVLLRMLELKKGMYPGLLIKMKKDGRSKDINFGVDGEVPGVNRAHQVLVVPQDNRIYIAGSEYGTYGTGSYKLDSGAYWFYIGGHKDGGRHPATTWWPTGICIGEGNKIYIGDLKIYDRTKPMLEGYLYSANTDPYVIRPGPSMEKSSAPDCFYRTGWNTGISKMRDTGSDVIEIYSLKLPFKTIGISCDAKRSLIFAASRMPEGFVSVIYDDGKSMREITQLKDPELGGIHTVRIFNDDLYVIEDGVSYTEDGYCAEEINKQPWTPKGKNRISRYRINFGKEVFLQVLEKK